MELDYYFADGVFLFALMALLASLGPIVGSFLKERCPAAFEFAARFGQRHPGLFTESDDFYCFFHKGSLYGN